MCCYCWCWGWGCCCCYCVYSQADSSKQATGRGDPIFGNRFTENIYDEGEMVSHCHTKSIQLSCSEYFSGRRVITNETIEARWADEKKKNQEEERREEKRREEEEDDGTVSGAGLHQAKASSRSSMQHYLSLLPLSNRFQGGVLSNSSQWDCDIHIIFSLAPVSAPFLFFFLSLSRFFLHSL